MTPNDRKILDGMRAAVLKSRNEAYEIVERKFIGDNAHLDWLEEQVSAGKVSLVTPSSETPTQRPIIQPQPVEIENTISTEDSLEQFLNHERGALIGSVRNAVRTINRDFTIDELLPEVVIRTGETPNRTSVASAVNRLLGRGELTIVSPARRNKPQVYRFSRIAAAPQVSI